MAAAAFSLAASAVYIFNDLADREQDREHPEKRHRPLAAGTVGVIQALLLAGFCMLSALMLSNDASKTVLLIVLVYALLNLAYSMGLKHIALLDVFIISTGFMLRILAGTLGSASHRRTGCCCAACCSLFSWALPSGVPS